MRLTQKLIALALGGAVVLGMAGAAMAALAVATTNVNVRSGPSAGYRVVDTLRRNEAVEVTRCSGGWCHVQKAGPDGWVSASYLAQGGRPTAAPRPSVNFSFSFGTPPAPQRPSHGGWYGHDRDDHRGGRGEHDRWGNSGRDDHRGGRDDRHRWSRD